MLRSVIVRFLKHGGEAALVINSEMRLGLLLPADALFYSFLEFSCFTAFRLLISLRANNAHVDQFANTWNKPT